MSRKFDILILGAGLSGIGAACHIKRKFKGRKTYALLERRQAIGGTWDLFRYPGIRSDSDMTTFGYNFHPWRGAKVLAEGGDIRQYVEDTAKRHKVLPNIHFGRRIIRISWSSTERAWTVTTQDEADGTLETWQAGAIIAATGYYNYDAGYTPKFPGEEAFQGQRIHPQHWPENTDMAGKNVVVIGSGATAITLVPALARQGAKVTMLQRTPTYVLSIPEIDPLWHSLSKVLPNKAVYAATRLRNIALQRGLYVASKQRPAAVRRLLRQRTRRALGKAVDWRHFAPDYNPWDQRLCVVPNGDLFKVLRRGEAQIVTDTIKQFDASGIELASGQHLDADVIVTATGLQLQFLGGAELSVDDEPVALRDRMVYKGMLLEGIPNFLLVTGYTNASWTLKADIVCEHFCRILKHMDRTGQRVVTPQPGKARPMDDTVMGSLQSGYVRRGADVLPRQGDRSPWALLNDYTRDAAQLKFGRLTHPDLHFAA